MLPWLTQCSHAVSIHLKSPATAVAKGKSAIARGNEKGLMDATGIVTETETETGNAAVIEATTLVNAIDGWTIHEIGIGTGGAAEMILGIEIESGTEIGTGIDEVLVTETKGQTIVCAIERGIDQGTVVESYCLRLQDKMPDRLDGMLEFEDLLIISQRHLQVERGLDPRLPLLLPRDKLPLSSRQLAGRRNQKARGRTRLVTSSPFI